MQTSKFVGTIGVLVVIVPLLGIPSLWKTTILVLLGLTLLAFSGWKYRQAKELGRSNVLTDVRTDSYVENRPEAGLRR